MLCRIVKGTREMTKGTNRVRCDWALKGDEAYQRYHDEEWGVPVHDDVVHFEFLMLETAQAGLSWAIVLRKREGYRQAFAEFQPDRVARFTEQRIEKLLLNPQIIRNRAKVRAAVSNAQAFLAIQDEVGSFDAYMWSFVKGRPIHNRWKSTAEVPATTPISDVLSRDLKKRGFKFVGSTVCYAHMQAAGLVNDHLVQCFRHKACK